MAALRSSLRLASLPAVAALLLHANPSEAQNNHYLTAQCGQSTATLSDTTFDPEVDAVSVLCSNGIPGSQDGGREISASASSASGILDARGETSNALNGNRKRGYARIEQRMRPNDGGDFGPIGVRASLGLSSGGLVLARNSAELRLGPCRVFVSEDIGGGSPGVTTGDADCNDSASVTWTTSASASGLEIHAAYASRPSSVLLFAEVIGYLGNGTVDIPTGQFSITGDLAVEQIGGTNAPTFESDTFLTVPEPDAALLAPAAFAALGALARSRYRTAS